MAWWTSTCTYCIALLLASLINYGCCFAPASIMPFATSCSMIPEHHDSRMRSLPSSKCSPIVLSMVRNIDLAEAIIFYGKDSLFQDSDGNMELLAGVENLVNECVRDETAILAILPESTCSDPSATALLPKEITIHMEAQSPPNPRDLWTAIHAIQVQPKGFGGSSGFGRKAADPERPPLPKHCVVLCHTEDQCRAARFAGMRVLCLTDNDLADAIMFDDCWESICMDDIATPGSFWLNPPHMKDDDGNKIDIEEVMEFYESGGKVKTKSEESSPSDDVAPDELDDDQLAAMLADIDNL